MEEPTARQKRVLALLYKVQSENVALNVSQIKKFVGGDYKYLRQTIDSLERQSLLASSGGGRGKARRSDITLKGLAYAIAYSELPILTQSLLLRKEDNDVLSHLVPDLKVRTHIIKAMTKAFIHLDIFEKKGGVPHDWYDKLTPYQRSLYHITLLHSIIGAAKQQTDYDEEELERFAEFGVKSLVDNISYDLLDSKKNKTARAEKAAKHVRPDAYATLDGGMHK